MNLSDLTIDVEELGKALKESRVIPEEEKKEILQAMRFVAKKLRLLSLEVEDEGDLDEEEDEGQTLSGKKNETIYIWSDGACGGNPGPGGWGTVVDAGGDRHEFSGYHPQTTNNIMEMTGALQGIIRTPEGSKIVVTTDSQYLIKGITQWIHGWKRKNWKKADGNPVLNRELWVALDKAVSKRSVQWEWIKGHSGHLENELCDELARNAIKKRG